LEPDLEDPVRHRPRLPHELIHPGVLHNAVAVRIHVDPMIGPGAARSIVTVNRIGFPFGGGVITKFRSLA
jgi:hypothetical protein